MKRVLLSVLAMCVLSSGTGTASWKYFTASSRDDAPAAFGPLMQLATPLPTAPASPRVAQANLPASQPVSVRIPALDVQGRPMRLGRSADGAMQVPPDARTIGWYANGPTPGEVGPAVLAAHVTYRGRHGAFYGIAGLRSGDSVEVGRADGRTVVFRVTAVRQYAKDRFPTAEVYGNVDHAGLRLITCAGEFDAAQHRYADNVVVFAELASVYNSGAA